MVCICYVFLFLSTVVQPQTMEFFLTVEQLSTFFFCVSGITMFFWYKSIAQWMRFFFLWDKYSCCFSWPPKNWVLFIGKNSIRAIHLKRWGSMGPPCCPHHEPPGQNDGKTTSRAIRRLNRSGGPDFFGWQEIMRKTWVVFCESGEAKKVAWGPGV